MCNHDIKKAAATAGVRLWKISDELGITDSTFSRKLRHELSQAEKEQIFEIIRKLSEDK